MFNYIKETIINDPSKIVANTVTLLGTECPVVTIKRAGEYNLAKIQFFQIFKTPAVVGAKEKYTITVSNALDASKIYRFTMFVKTPSIEFVEYAYPNYQEFGKPILVEFSGKGSANNDAKALCNALNLALQPDNNMFKASVSENVITLEFTENYMKVDSMDFSEFNALTDEFDLVDSLSTNGTKLTYTLVTAGQAEFGTAKWIVENLRFPSYPNLRYNRLYADEAPIPGAKYTQYAFQYIVKHSVPGGVSGVGQIVDSLTTHVFYVLEDGVCDAAFEAAFSPEDSLLGMEIIPVEYDSPGPVVSNLGTLNYAESMAILDMRASIGAVSELGTAVTGLGTAVETNATDIASIKSAATTASGDGDAFATAVAALDTPTE